jgi:hypothetical protein
MYLGCHLILYYMIVILIFTCLVLVIKVGCHLLLYYMIVICMIICLVVVIKVGCHLLWYFMIVIRIITCLVVAIKVGCHPGRDFSGEPGIKAPRKSLKVTGNPCWSSPFLGFNYDCCLVFLPIRINSCLKGSFPVNSRKHTLYIHFPSLSSFL